MGRKSVQLVVSVAVVVVMVRAYCTDVEERRWNWSTAVHCR